jgi:hypothetical protein
MGTVVPVKAIGAITLLLLAVAAVHAQTPQSTSSQSTPSQSTPAEKRSPLSEIAHDLTTWLSHVTGSSTGSIIDHHRVASSPPLPRPRPMEPAPASTSNGGSSETAPAAAPPRKKIVAPVQIND